MEELDLTFVDRTVERLGTGADKVLEILQSLQTHYGYLPTEALQRVCERTEITPAAITGVSTFYDQFRHRPAGKHTIRVCIGTACHVKGGQQVFDAFKRYLHIPDDDDTDAEKLFTVEKVACIGCCMLAPAIQIDDIVYGHLNDHRVPIVLKDFLEQEKAAGRRKRKERVSRAGTGLGELRICLDSSCRASGSEKVYESLKTAVHQTRARAVVKSVSCSGMSYLTPLVEVVLPDGTSFRYGNVEPQDAKAIVLRHFKPRRIGGHTASAVSNLLDRVLTDENREPVTRYSVNVRDHAVSEYLGRQVHIATEHCGCIDPTDLDEYLANGGFQSLQKSLCELDPQGVIDQIERSGLRGRGGAGFPTHRKWATVRAQDAEKKYVVCNGDEGDPGAFMDRMLMESYPYRVLEGMAVAARCIGAKEGYLYIRAEYPLAIKRIGEAIEKCVERGYLGDGILGSDFSLHLKIVAGAGAFVCGEETALIASIEGRRGMPKLRPPYPAIKGLWSSPTLINNVETYAAVPWILRNGAEAYASIGTDGSKGTKVFALAGKVARGGLIEVPMGISIRQVVDEIGGGVAGGLNLKAVQVGGPSGGCVPADLDHLPVDYESLTGAGAMMGSGGLVVLDETDCMVDIARYFLEFTQNQSCGKCTFCRIGTRRMLDILDRLCTGHGRAGDLDELEHLAEMVQKGSLCGLGKTAPNPVLSTLKYFHKEYEAHIQKRCPAGKCKALITYSITDDCIGCTICAQHCPTDAIAMKPYEKHEIDPDKCVRCGTCKSVCPADAVRVE
ncbi:NAD(P)H-dependent oxidoreductase subunit E [Anaerobaca lacustris]|uniref:NAD(P)H-dependent oxidoreductase subunit E n=1 Tax=Anaerobaca lacustris TaxID=3044600 RepID=A0AAW6TSJ7_9BACT|nr:NAD(P)H-dependent oxidoreductase subunit E [Sedimentisphaerales bacterium M17dextr]